MSAGKFFIALILGITAAGLTGFLNPQAQQAVQFPKLGSTQGAVGTARPHSDAACKANGRCDSLTGCIAPAAPAGPVFRDLPKSKAYERYVKELEAFQACRQKVFEAMKPQGEPLQLAGSDTGEHEDKSFAKTLRRWNGDIFWAPASASSNTLTRFGDEARAVFGPIPEGNCADTSARSFPVEVEGNIVSLKPNPEKPDQPLEFEHKDPTGKVVKWTDGIPRCDKPSLAANTTYCGLNSRVNRVERGAVEWLFFCRKSTPHLEVWNEPYWLASNSKFQLFGTIGFNRRTGEIVFFDGRKDQKEFDWSKPFVPPGGQGYSDKNGRRAAEALYDPTFQIQCSACHDNKNAYIIDPRAGQARVGYFKGVEDPRAKAFSLGDYLPETPRLEGAPFRIIGSGYTSTYKVEISRARTLRDPTGNCTNCHSLTTQTTGRRFAADAVAKEPWVSNPTWGQLLILQSEKLQYSRVAAHRTPWALRSGAGKIHPWMLPELGNKLDEVSPEISEADWKKLSDCLWGEGGSECGYQPLYTACPAPGSGPGGDGFEPSALDIAVLPLPSGETGTTRRLRVTWTYLNRYGSVPQRDDVRFNLAIREIALPPSGKRPGTKDFPSREETGSEGPGADGPAVATADSLKLIRNISYPGHSKWTEPVPASTVRGFKVDLPARCNRRYLLRLLPKRFCFDQSNIAYSDTDHLLYADIPCDPI